MDALIGDESFWVAAGASLVLLLAVRASGRHRAIGVGLPIAAGTLAGLADVRRLPIALVGALVLLAVGAWLTTRRSWLVRAAATLPGAAVLGVAVGSKAATWTHVVAACATVVVAPLATSLDRDHPRLAGALVAGSALGVYAAVPDTEEARVLVAATLVGGAWGLTRRSPDAVGTTVLVGLLAWTAAIGGYARPGSVVGGVACMGVLALAPVVAWAAPSVVVLFAAHGGLVVVASRVAGLREQAWVATAIVAGAYALAVLALVSFRARGRGGTDGRADQAPKFWVAWTLPLA